MRHKMKPGFVTIALGAILFSTGVYILLRAMYKLPSAETDALFGLMLSICGAVLVVFFVNISERQSLITKEVGKLSDRILQFGERNVLGLVEVAADASTYDYGAIISKPKHLTIVLNHGQTWVGVHIDRLRKRFADPTKETTFFLIHPDSPLVPIVARKSSTEPEAVKAKLVEAISMIHSIKNEKSKVNIYGHYLYNTYAACIGDDEAVVTTYFISRGARTVPVLRFGDTGPDCVFRELVDDVKKLKLDSEDIDDRSSDFSMSKTENLILIPGRAS